MKISQSKLLKVMYRAASITGVLVVFALGLWYGHAKSAPHMDTSPPTGGFGSGAYVGGAYLPMPQGARRQLVTLQPFQPSDLTTAYVNGRFGFGLTSPAAEVYENGLATYLNAGWYWNWGAHGATKIPPLTYIQTVRLSPVKGQVDGRTTQIGYTASPTGATLLERIRQAPGAMWFIGNEPDCAVMDNMLSEFYAYAYHDLYYLIKGADPTAKIGAGNIVQPTQLRINYLDRVLDTYAQTYSETLPTDFWSTHSYILCENCHPTPPAGDPFAWGACFVPDWNYQNAPDATYYSVYEHWDVDIYASRLISFRQWMYDNGYRDHPIVIPEYGTLLWPGLVGTTQQDDIDFLNATADWMRTARNPVTGYKSDDNRLVQRWAWYSLDHGSWPGGSLFIDNNPTYLGNAYRDYTSAVAPAVEPKFLDVSADTPLTTTGDAFTTTLSATIANAGNIKADGAVTITFYSHTSPYIPTTAIPVGDLGCCGDRKTFTVEVTNLPRSGHQFCVDFKHPSTLILNTQCYVLGVDLQVKRASSPVIFTTDETVTATLRATVFNNGDMATGEPVTVSFYVSETLVYPIGNVTIDALAAGEEKEVSVLWPHRTPGYRQFCVAAHTSYLNTPPVCKYQWVNPAHSLYMPVILHQ